jgi:HflK protein
MQFDGQFTPSPKQAKKAEFSPKKIKALVILAIVVIFVISLAGTCWYTVDEKERAVITTFGKVTDVTDAGIHFKLPFGIQQVHKVNFNVYQKIEIGYRSDSATGDYSVVEKESKMITGDYNIVNVDFFVEFKVSDAEKYLFSSYEPELILKNLVQSQIRNVIGSCKVDSVLTDGKAEIQLKIKDLIVGVLDTYDIGLVLTDIKIQDSEPPTTSVIEAFKEVETAKQKADTVINQAKAYENSELPRAQAQADKLTQNAEYLKQRRINDAVKQIAIFNAMYEEYALNPDITRIRMYYETLTEALPGVKLFIDATEGSNTQKLLPLESFVAGSEVAE